jgi:hypothetical protein
LVVAEIQLVSGDGMFQVFLQLWAKCSRALVILFLAVHCLFGLSNTASAEDPQPLWATVKAWEVRVDTTLMNGCFAMTAYDEGTIVRIGINPASHQGYIMFGNDKWESLESGKDYKIKLKFDDELPWEGSARAREFGKERFIFLWVDFTDANLYMEFMRKNLLQIFYNKKKVTALNLSGSAAALSEVIECQKAMNAVTPTPSNKNEKDPFASDVRYKADPFAP